MATQQAKRDAQRLRTAQYRARQRNLLGDVAYRAQEAATRRARRVRAGQAQLNQPPPIPQNLPIDIDDIGPPIQNNPFSPPIIPPRPTAQKLRQFLQSQKPPTIPPRPQPTIPPRPPAEKIKQFLQSQNPPTIPPRPQQKINNPMMNSDNYINRMNNMFGIETEQPIQVEPKPIPKSRLNILLKQHNQVEPKPDEQKFKIPDEQYLYVPEEEMERMRKSLTAHIIEDVKETTLKQYNNKVLNFYNKFYKDKLGEIPNNSTPLSPKYNEWVYDKKLFIDIKNAYEKPDTQRALTTAILSLVERDKTYENENLLKKRLRTLQVYFQKQANEKKN